MKPSGRLGPRQSAPDGVDAGIVYDGHSSFRFFLKRAEEEDDEEEEDEEEDVEEQRETMVCSLGGQAAAMMRRYRLTGRRRDDGARVGLGKVVCERQTEECQAVAGCATVFLRRVPGHWVRRCSVKTLVVVEGERSAVDVLQVAYGTK